MQNSEKFSTRDFLQKKPEATQGVRYIKTDRDGDGLTEDTYVDENGNIIASTEEPAPDYWDGER